MLCVVSLISQGIHLFLLFYLRPDRVRGFLGISLTRSWFFYHLNFSSAVLRAVQFDLVAPFHLPHGG